MTTKKKDKCITDEQFIENCKYSCIRRLHVRRLKLAFKEKFPTKEHIVKHHKCFKGANGIKKMSDEMTFTKLLNSVMQEATSATQKEVFYKYWEEKQTDQESVLEAYGGDKDDIRKKWTSTKKLKKPPAEQAPLKNDAKNDAANVTDRSKAEDAGMVQSKTRAGAGQVQGRGRGRGTTKATATNNIVKLLDQELYNIINTSTSNFIDHKTAYEDLYKGLSKIWIDVNDEPQHKNYEITIMRYIDNINPQDPNNNYIGHVFKKNPMPFETDNGKYFVKLCDLPELLISDVASHLNIAPSIECFGVLNYNGLDDTSPKSSNTHCMVMESMDCTLYQYIFEYEPDASTFLEILKKICKHLNTLQQYSFMHRDLHLSNIGIVNPKSGNVPEVKLLDFGMSYMTLGDKVIMPNVSDDVHMPKKLEFNPYIDLATFIFNLNQDHSVYCEYLQANGLTLKTIYDDSWDQLSGINLFKASLKTHKQQQTQYKKIFPNDSFNKASKIMYNRLENDNEKSLYCYNLSETNFKKTTSKPTKKTTSKPTTNPTNHLEFQNHIPQRQWTVKPLETMSTAAMETLGIETVFSKYTPVEFKKFLSLCKINNKNTFVQYLNNRFAPKKRMTKEQIIDQIYSEQNER